MCDEGQTKLDVYDWVLSPEIREHMRTARPLTIEEKADIIDGGCRPIVDKYAALTALLREADREEDKKRSLQTCSSCTTLAFEELHSGLRSRCFLTETWGSPGPRTGRDVSGVIRPMELTDYLKEYGVLRSSFGVSRMGYSGVR